MEQTEIRVTAAEVEAARAQAHRSFWHAAIAACVILAILVIPATMLGAAVGDGVAGTLYSALFALLIGTPFIAYAAVRARGLMTRGDGVVDDLRADLTAALETAEAEAVRREKQALQQDFESRLANALDMAHEEPDVVDVVERAFVAAIGDAPAELLLADNSHAHLTRMAASPAAAGTPLCSVESPDKCPAARRAQVQRFADSEALDACPKLRHRAAGACSAVCLPVSIMGRTVGVLHVTGASGELPSEGRVNVLSNIANQAGARIGLLRIMADTQLQASTDALTGLLNRRSFENAVRGARGEHDRFAVVMADLDHFKHLNDTYGHDTGDRALRLFAQTLQAGVRQGDIVARYGGEEFAVVLPSCSTADATVILDGIRAALAAATNDAGLPSVTVSFGVADVDASDDLTVALGIADAALLQAKRSGRDRVVCHGDQLALVPEAAAG